MNVKLAIRTILPLVFLYEVASGQISTFPPNKTELDPNDGAEISDINAKSRKIEILQQLLYDARYDSKIRPLGVNGSGPVHVSINIFLRNIENIDDVRMEYTAQLTFRQSWVDPRLTFENIQKNVDYLQLINRSQLWSPDVFFENEKNGIVHSIVVPNVFTRIFPDGTVLQSFRFTLLLSCPMNLRAYPMDVQTCPLTMSTYGYGMKDLILNWKDKSPIEYKTFLMPQFRIISYSTKSCSSITATDSFSCLELEIGLERAFGFYLIQIYIPCAMLVLVSWVSFWLEPTAVEARVSLGVTTILSIVTQTYGINQNAPPASYIKALDIWTALCQIQIFGGLLEFALVNYTSKLSSPMRQHLQQMELTSSVALDEFEKVFEHEVEKTKINLEKAKRIDKISRMLFPSVFLLFNIAYWTSYGVLVFS